MLSIGVDLIESTRIVSPAVDSPCQNCGSQFARDLENIAPVDNPGWVKNVVDSPRFDRIDMNCFPFCRFDMLEVNLHETVIENIASLDYAGCMVKNVLDLIELSRIDTNRLPCC